MKVEESQRRGSRKRQVLRSGRPRRRSGEGDRHRLDVASGKTSGTTGGRRSVHLREVDGDPLGGGAGVTGVKGLVVYRHAHFLKFFDDLLQRSEASGAGYEGGLEELPITLSIKLLTFFVISLSMA